MDAKVLTTALDALSPTDRAKAEAYIAVLQQQDYDYAKQLEQEAILNATIQNLPYDVWITDISLRLIAVHPKTTQKLNQELGILAIPGRNLLTEIEGYAPQVASSWNHIFRRALAGKTTRKKHTVNSGQSGRRYYQESVVGPYYDTSGKIIGCIGTYRDISELKHLQNYASAQEQISSAILEEARAGIDIIDITHFDGKNHQTAKLLSRNSKMEQYLQSEDQLFITESEIDEVFDHLQYDELNSNQFCECVLEDIQQKRKSRKCFRLKDKSGQYLDIDALFWIIQVDEKLLLLRFFRDITNSLHQKKLIDNQIWKLNQQNEKLERYIESNMQLENFAYIAAHDLRAPIRSITGYARILERALGSKLNEHETVYLNYIISSAKNMQRLIGDLLDYSCANSEKIKLKEVSLDLIKSEIEKNIGLNLDDHHISINWAFDWHTIIADHTKLQQVLENLINNAIKFMPSGKHPEIVVSMKEQADYWLFEVKDNGIGIEEAYHDQIFTIFRRLNGQVEYQGTGIGLALCKQLVEQHKGHIWLKSSLGEGSTFSFTIAKNIEV